MVHVTAPSFVAGAVYKDGKFVRSAPIVWRFARWRSLEQFVEYCNSRLWKVRLIR
jgi:hypothetical protein